MIIDGEACALDDLAKAILSLLIFVYSTDPDDRIKRRALRLVHGPMIAVVRTRQNDWGRLEVR